MNHGIKRDIVLMAKQVDVVTDLSRISNSWKLMKYGQNGLMTLECADPKLSESTVSVGLSRVGGLGLDLVELSVIDKSKYGLVVISDIVPNSNADKTGQFQIGDALVTISTPMPKGTTSTTPEMTARLEGLNFDATIAEISKFSEYTEIVLTVRRLTVRKTITVQLYDPKGANTGLNFTVLSGYNGVLRTALLNNDIKLYDDRTARFDSPYQSGDCGGEGTCGTCVVAVLSGAELLGPRKKQEDMALKQQLQPPNYRWACRLKIGPSPDQGGIVKIKLRPQTVTW